MPAIRPDEGPLWPVNETQSLGLVEKLLLAAFDRPDDLLRFAARFELRADLREHESLNNLCFDFARKLISRNGGVAPGFVEELYQGAPRTDWAKLRRVVHDLTRFELAEAPPPREADATLSQIRLELDAPDLSLAEAQAFIARIEALFDRPTVRAFDVRSLPGLTQVALYLPADAARTLRKRGRRRLTSDTGRPVLRVVGGSTAAVAMWELLWTWLERHGAWAVAGGTTCVAVVALAAAPTSPECARVESPECPLAEPSPRASAGLLREQCPEPVADESTQLELEAQLAATRKLLQRVEAQLTAERSACATDKRLAADALARCEDAPKPAAPGCPLPPSWAVHTGVLSEITCGDKACASKLTSGEELRWLKDSPTDLIPPTGDRPGALMAGARVCVEARNTKGEPLVVQRMRLVPKP